MRWSIVLVGPLALCTACSTLGPVPVATAISPVPRQRFDAEVQLGFVPGFYLSGATAEIPRGSAIAQASAVIEPGFVDGLLVGGRVFGPGHDGQSDPLVGYRTTFGETRHLAVAIVGFGAYMEGTQKRATYKATRLGGELSGDLRLGAPRHWFEPHLEASLSVTGVSASGDYCTNDKGYGADCPDEPEPVIQQHASNFGVYPAATAGASLFFGHHNESWIHGMRAMIALGAGLMPRLGALATDKGVQPYASFGFALSMSFGAPR